MNQMFPFNNALVRRFLNWKQGDEEDTWRTKAVETLVKKLKKQSEQQYSNLQIAISRKNDDTPCVALSKSQDGRLQVSHKKMLPHVMYCRIFRWPDLQSQHELRSVPNCAYPATRREREYVCVNPFHYIRVEHTAYPPVVTPRNGNEFADASPPPQSPFSAASSTYSQPGQGYYCQQTTNIPAMCYGGEYYQSSSQSPLPGYSMTDHNNCLMQIDDNIKPSSVPPGEENQEHWCRITYAELNQKIGEPFKGSSSTVIVDGYTDPSVHNRRFSLGCLSNVNRNSTIEMTRRAIRKGVSLENNGNQIYVTNLSESSIFFHSKNCNVENQLHQHTVIKIEHNGKMKIFDQKIFENLVEEAIRAQDGKTYERLFSLIEHCVVKMSFVKGWGSIYQRQDVTSTPCWIEIHLLKPYALIDRHLREAIPPSCQITSTS